ncbi:MAG: type transport system ATP-binding protein [Actinomycetota bacterium]|nr:type transport system ATP-binding protein [Actinomycetota bacterium]
MYGPGRATTLDRVIDVENLTKRYGDVTVLDGLTFHVQPGVVTGFLGPNGAGKSTTMRIVLGLTRPDTGSARIAGRAYHELARPLHQVGAVLETALGHPGLKARDHLAWLARSNRIPRRRVHEVLEVVGLTETAGRRLGTLSLGMGQRLRLAAALLGDPGVLVLDEPVNGLDPEGIRWLRETLRRMAAEDRTVFVSSHLLSEMSQVADHLVVLNHGRLIADTTAAEFVDRHGRTYVRVRSRESAQLAAALERAGATVTATSDNSLEVTGMDVARVSGVAAAVEAPLEELVTCTASLEDTFLGIVGREGRAPHA